MANKTSFVLGKSKKYYLIIGAVILGIAVVHFGMQMVFIQKETLRSFESAIITDDVPFSDVETVEANSPVEQTLEISPEHLSEKKVELITVPEIRITERRRKEIVTPEPKIVRKKEVRETRADRLRRAERILTGI